MGRAGTEVAKEAADMVPTDDDFATIEAAVEEGRGVFDNLTKVIVWTLPTTWVRVWSSWAQSFGSVLPILPVQILWINMTTAVALRLRLASSPMNQESGPGHPAILGAAAHRRAGHSDPVGLCPGGTCWLFGWELANGASVAKARSVGLNLLATVEAFYHFSCRSLTQSGWRVGFFSNR